jgi:RNA polymerase sigma-70 factor (ECF subfamily)
LDEAALIGRAQAGDREALGQLLMSYRKSSYAFALRMTGRAEEAEDVCQDAFLRAFRDLASFRPARGSFRSWLFGLVAHAHGSRASSERARRRRERSREMGAREDGAASAGLEREELRRQLDRALGRLAERYRLPIVLHYEQGFSYGEVAASLAMPEGTVATNIRRGLEDLRVVMARAGYATAALGAVEAALSRLPVVQAPSSLAVFIQNLVAGTATKTAGAAAAASAGGLALGWKLLAGLSLATLLGAGGYAGWRQLRPPAAAPRPEAPPARAEPLPHPVSSISGAVVDAKTRQPVSGLGVALRSDEGAKLLPLPGEETVEGLPTATTDEAGRYCLRFMTDSRRRLSLMIHTRSEKHGGAYRYVGVYRGEAVTAKEMQVTAYASVRARVLDPDGKPVAGARVRGNGSAEYLTDADGRFTDSRVPAHRFGWTVAAQGFELERFTFWIGNPGEGEPAIRLVRCKPVTGTVTEADGRPAKNARVYAGGYPSVNVLPNWWVPVGDDGSYEMGTMPKKGAAAWIFPVRDREIVGEPVRAEPGQENVTLKLYAVGRIEVEVRDEAGRPVEGAQVRSGQKDPGGGDNLRKFRWGTTDAKGRAVIEGAPAGRTKVELMRVAGVARLYARGPRPSFETEVSAGATARGKLALPARPKGAQAPPRISGFLLDELDRPVLHARVGACLKLEQKGIGTHRGNAWTEVDGRFEIEMPYDSGERDGKPRWEPPAPEKAGQVRIVATLSGYGGNVLDVTRQWPEGGRVLDAGRIAVKLAAEREIVVKAARPGSPRLRVALSRCTDEAGRDIPFRRIEGGTYGLSPAAECRIAVRHGGAIRIHLDDDLGNRSELVVPAGAAGGTPLAASFPAARKVELTVTDGAGRPVKDMRFFGRPAERRWSFPQNTGFCIDSDADGKIAFELAPQASGRFLLFASLAWQPYHGEIRAGTGPVRRTVKLKAADAVASGRVTDPAGRAAPAARARLAVGVGGFLSTSFDVDLDGGGRFSVAVPSGIAVTLQAHAETKDGRLEGETERVTPAPGQKLNLELRLEPERPPWMRHRRPRPQPVPRLPEPAEVF